MFAAAAPNRRLVLSLAALAYACAFGAFVAFERPGLGTAHFFYVPICVIALGSDEIRGAAAGAVAAGLYAAAVELAPHMPSMELLTWATIIRLSTYTGVGAILGWYARWNRTLVVRLHEHALEDFLTGIGNARRFGEELARRCEAGRAFTLVLGDVDEFKRINDTHGHEAGNGALKRVAQALREAAPPAAVIARIGGDEFAVLTHLTPGQTGEVCDRASRILALEGLHLSFGTTSLPEDGATADELFRKADDRLFAAKLVSRNRRTVVDLASSS